VGGSGGLYGGVLGVGGIGGGLWVYFNGCVAGLLWMVEAGRGLLFCFCRDRPSDYVASLRV